MGHKNNNITFPQCIAFGDQQASVRFMSNYFHNCIAEEEGVRYNISLFNDAKNFITHPYNELRRTIGDLQQGFLINKHGVRPIDMSKYSN